MKNSAFDDFSEGVMAACYEAYDFKTCQRSDGTTYGVPSGSACAQKGAKEVKGGGGMVTETRAKMAKSADKFDKDVLKDLDVQALEDLASKLKGSGDKVDKAIAKKAQGRADAIRAGEQQQKIDLMADPSNRGYTNEFYNTVDGMSNSMADRLGVPSGDIAARETGTAMAVLKWFLEAGVLPEVNTRGRLDGPTGVFKEVLDKVSSKDPKVREEGIEFVKNLARENGVAWPRMIQKSDLPENYYWRPTTTAEERKKAAAQAEDKKVKERMKRFEDKFGTNGSKPASKPAPKSKPKHTYNKQQTEDQYRNFYGMGRAKGMSHLAAADAAMRGLREKGFDRSQITPKFRKKAGEESGYKYP